MKPQTLRWIRRTIGLLLLVAALWPAGSYWLPVTPFVFRLSFFVNPTVFSYILDALLVVASVGLLSSRGWGFWFLYLSLPFVFLAQDVCYIPGILYLLPIAHRVTALLLVNTTVTIGIVGLHVLERNAARRVVPPSGTTDSRAS